MEFSAAVELVGRGMDGAGIVAIVGGILVATIFFAVRLSRRTVFENAYRFYRQGVGRALLLGLEILVAADIIRTVAISPTFTSVGVLALIVLIRTFLSWTLELELEGSWPWRHARGEPPSEEQGRAPEQP